jgi:HEAT repeat protein
MAQIVKSPQLNFTIQYPLVKLLRSPHLPLKLGALNCFFAQKSYEEFKFVEFCMEVWKAPREVQLRFIELIGESPYASTVGSNIVELLIELLKDTRWRTRLGAVLALRVLEGALNNPELKATFSTLALGLTEDEAHPVRKAAMFHLATDFVRESDKIPPLVETLKTDGAFRRRQTAIGILAAMYEVVRSLEFKERILNAIKGFELDPINNVSLLAIATVRQLTG